MADSTLQTQLLQATVRKPELFTAALAGLQPGGSFSRMHAKTISIAETCLVPIDPSLLKKCPLGEDVDVAAARDALVIRPVRRVPRQGWAKMLAVVPTEALERDTTELATFRETPHDWDSKEW